LPDAGSLHIRRLCCDRLPAVPSARDRAHLLDLMSQRRRRVYIDTPRGRLSAGFTVPGTADAADVAMQLRERGWAPYKLRLDLEQHAWIAVVIDWKRVA
jgi:hypothetical protein